MTEEQVNEQDTFLTNTFLTKDEVCQKLAISPATLGRMVKAGTIPAPLSLSRQLRRWKLSEIDKWIDSLHHD